MTLDVTFPVDERFQHVYRLTFSERNGCVKQVDCLKILDNGVELTQATPEDLRQSAYWFYRRYDSVPSSVRDWVHATSRLFGYGPLPNSITGEMEPRRMKDWVRD